MSDEYMQGKFKRNVLLNIFSETERLANVGGWEWDIVKDIWTFTDNWLRIHGCIDRHLTTSDLIPIAHPDDRGAIQKAFDRAVAEGAIYEIEHRIIRQDTGEERYIRALGRPELDGKGKVVKLFGSAQDITEHKNAEDKLIKSEQKYRILLESLQEGIWMINSEGNSTFVNSSIAEMLGYTEEEMLGKHLSSFMDVNWKIQFKDLFERRKKGIKEQHDFVFQHKNGKPIYTTVITSPLEDDSGRFIGAVAGIIDISERVKAENSLKEHKDKLEEKVAERTQKLQIMVDSMAGREVRMAELKKVIEKLSKQLEDAGMTPVADDPLTMPPEF